MSPSLSQQLSCLPHNEWVLYQLSYNLSQTYPIRVFKLITETMVGLRCSLFTDVISEWHIWLKGRKWRRFLYISIKFTTENFYAWGWIQPKSWKITSLVNDKILYHCWCIHILCNILTICQFLLISIGSHMFSVPCITVCYIAIKVKFLGYQWLPQRSSKITSPHFSLGTFGSVSILVNLRLGQRRLIFQLLVLM